MDGHERHLHGESNGEESLRKVMSHSEWRYHLTVMHWIFLIVLKICVNYLIQSALYISVFVDLLGVTPCVLFCPALSTGVEIVVVR